MHTSVTLDDAKSNERLRLKNFRGMNRDPKWNEWATSLNVYNSSFKAVVREYIFQETAAILS